MLPPAATVVEMAFITNPIPTVLGAGHNDWNRSKKYLILVFTGQVLFHPSNHE